MRRLVRSLASIALAMVVAVAPNLARASCPSLHDIQDMIAAGFSSRTIREVFAESHWDACLSATDLDHLRRSGLPEAAVAYVDERARVAPPSEVAASPVGYASAYPDCWDYPYSYWCGGFIGWGGGHHHHHHDDHGHFVGDDWGRHHGDGHFSGWDDGFHDSSIAGHVHSHVGGHLGHGGEHVGHSGHGGGHAGHGGH